ncbi:MAG: hypothetical protein Pars92KO_10130 [Parasphingorhabdus sp.]
MITKRLCAVLLSSSLLAGCGARVAPYSFAPPSPPNFTVCANATTYKSAESFDYSAPQARQIGNGNAGDQTGDGQPPEQEVVVVEGEEDRPIDLESVETVWIEEGQPIQGRVQPRLYARVEPGAERAGLIDRNKANSDNTKTGSSKTGNTNGDCTHKTDPKGAVALVDVYMTAYDNAYRENANGRQAFEVPSLIATIGGVTAAAFGGNPDAVIFGGAVNSTLGAGNSYYAPQSKASMYADAFGALLCLRKIAIGEKAADISSSIREQKIFFPNTDFDAQQAEFDRKIYNAIEGGVYDIRTILSQRLLSAGSFTDASNIASDYKKALEEQIKQEAKAEAAKEEVETGSEQLLSQMSLDDSRKSMNQLLTAQVFTFRAMTNKRNADYTAMQSEIATCILQAKV